MINMKQFDRDVIAREEEANYRLLMSRPRQYWIDLYLEKVRPNYTSLSAWKHRETVEDVTMPVDAERIYIKTRDGYDGLCGCRQPLISFHADPEQIPECPHIGQRQLEGLEGYILQCLFHGTGIIGLPDKSQCKVQVLCRYAAPLYAFLFQVVESACNVLL